MVLEWEKDVSLYSTREGKSFLTIASFGHLYFGFILQLLFAQIYPTNTFIVLVISNILHIVEDYLENTNVFSIEHITSKITGCSNKLFLDVQDHDSMQNFMGDIVTYLIGSLIAYKFQRHLEFLTIPMIVIVILAAIFLTINCRLIK